jgi:hypothetical protein
MGWIKNRRARREAAYFARTGRRSYFAGSIDATPTQLHEIWKLGLTTLQPTLETAILDLFPADNSTWKRQFDALSPEARSAYSHLVNVTGASARGEMRVVVDVTDPSNFHAICDYGLHSIDCSVYVTGDVRDGRVLRRRGEGLSTPVAYNHDSGHSVTFDMTIPESISFRSNLTDAGVPVSLVEDLEDQ